MAPRWRVWFIDVPQPAYGSWRDDTSRKTHTSPPTMIRSWAGAIARSAAHAVEGGIMRRLLESEINPEAELDAEGSPDEVTVITIDSDPDD